MGLVAAAAKDAVTTAVFAFKQVHGKGAVTVFIPCCADDVTVNAPDFVFPVFPVFEGYVIWCLSPVYLSTYSMRLRHFSSWNGSSGRGVSSPPT